MQGPTALTVQTAATATSIYTLLVNAGLTNVRAVCSELHIQADPNGGGAKYEIGNSNVSTINRGAELIAGQLFVIGPYTSNLIQLKEVYLISDTNPANWNLLVQVR